MSVLATGSLLALNDVITADSLDSNGSVGVVLTGTWVGTISFQGSVDGVLYTDVFVLGLNGTFVTSTAANGSFIVNPAGLHSFRVKVTAYTSGTATATIQLGGAGALINTLSTVVGNTDGTRIGNILDQLKSDDTARVSGVYSELTVNTSAVEAKVGGSKLSNRKYLSLRPKDNGIYYGFDNSVTTTTGTVLFKDELMILPYGISVWLIASGSGKKISIGEAS